MSLINYTYAAKKGKQAFVCFQLYKLISVYWCYQTLDINENVIMALDLTNKQPSCFSYALALIDVFEDVIREVCSVEQPV